jgi:ubiquinone/menaquinone biosynthesis C-methylase UbiE
MNPINFANPESNVAALGLHEGMVVADLGSGTGAYTLLLAERVGETGHVYAVEVQKEFLSNIKNDAARRGLKNIEVIWGDIERKGGTKIKDSIADVVVVSNVLFQAEDKKGLIQEAKRILKQGGRILLVDWTSSFKGMGPTQEMIVDAATARHLFESEGFALTKEIPAGDHHYGFIMVKSQ